MKKLIVLIFWILLAWAIAILGIITYKILFVQDLETKQTEKINKIKNKLNEKVKKQYSYFAVLPTNIHNSNYSEKFIRNLWKKHFNIKNIIIINKAPKSQTKFYKSFSKNWKYCIWSPLDFKEENCIKAKSFPFYIWENIFTFFRPTKTFFSNNKKNYTLFPLIKKHIWKNVNVYNISLKEELNNFSKTEKLFKQMENYKFEKWNILYLSLSDFSSFPQDKIAIFHDLKSINTLNSKEFSKIEVSCQNCLYLVKKLANKKGKNFFNISNRQVIKSKKIWEKKYFSSLKSNIYWEFENIKKEKVWMLNLWNYNSSKFNNSFNLIWWDTNKKIYWAFFGDTHFTRWFTYKNNLAFKKDYFQCFYEDFDVKKDLKTNISRMLYSFDFVWVNLETSVVSDENCEINNKVIKFRTESKYLQDFKDIWVNIFNLANNHSYDCWKKWFEATKKNLDFYGLEYFWNPNKIDNILEKEINWLKVAFVWINLIWKIVDIEKFEKEIRKLKQRKFLVIINIHWWEEFSLEVSDKQKQIARRLVDAWANLIVWHHPHTVQDSEIYAWVPIFYSLWNFFFDQHFKDTLKWQGLIYELSKNEIKYSLIDFERDPKTWKIKCDSFK